jgi:hypothetical protein
MIWQFPDGNGAKLIAEIWMNPDEADRHIDVAFRELVACEFTNAIVEDMGPITICLWLATVLVRTKCAGYCIKEAFFRTMLQLLLNLIPHLPEEVRYDACDVLSSIIMMWNRSDWIPETAGIETCQLHERALQEGSFDDRQRVYRFVHNFFACFPDHAAQMIPIECLTPVFNFVMKTHLIFMQDSWRTVFTFVVRAVQLGYPLTEFEIYLGEVESSGRVWALQKYIENHSK